MGLYDRPRAVFKCTEPGCENDALRLSEGIKCREHKVDRDSPTADAYRRGRREAFAEAAEMFRVKLGDGSTICLLCHYASHGDDERCRVAKLKARAKE